MKKLVVFCLVFVFVGCSSEDNGEVKKEKKAITLNGRTNEEILTYFDELIQNSQVIVGQHCGDGNDVTEQYYNTYIKTLAQETGKYVGLMGADFGFSPSDNHPVGALIDHWNNGGLVTVSWHADNPFVPGYDAYWNTVENRDAIDLNSLLKSANNSLAKTNYRSELDDIAKALQQLKNNGVTVIWRPFHEMNGDFFWWGINAYNNEQTNEQDFVNLWRDIYDTLTNDYGLDNLIWTYAPVPFLEWNADVLACYPGEDYVDLVGIDYYGETPNFPNYDELKTLNKTIVMTEAGPTGAGYGNWDQMELVNKIKGKAAYFLQWHSWENASVAIIDNKNATEMMNSSAVVTRDEINSN